MRCLTDRDRLGSKGLCDHPYKKKIKKPPKFLQKAPFLSIFMRDYKGPCDNLPLRTDELTALDMQLGLAPGTAWDSILKIYYIQQKPIKIKLLAKKSILFFNKYN
jgi:hypothetical protein